MSCWFLTHDVREAESAVAEPDVNAFGSLCGVESEPLGSGPGYLGSNQQASDFAGNLRSKLLVWIKKKKTAFPLHLRVF